ncbi:high mobility group box domain-containing protein, partial [Cokeromyces recurvatus]|uniref:high mobility group box domain-containing protein n=1 Tax=Cokeromyces recurvatus TaxID=90255 RepID=UPI00221EA4AF
ISTQLAKARHHIKRLRVERIDSELSISESIMSDARGGNKKNATPTPKKKRDPNAPKGPGNVFFLFCRMERENIKDEVPSESLGEITRLLGQKWKSLTKEEKQKYYDIYKKEQEEYETAMKSYTAAGGGAEGAAAVEAAANKSKQQNEDEETDEEEIDMLQDEEDDEIEEEEGGEGELEEETNMTSNSYHKPLTSSNLHITQTMDSPNSSVATNQSSLMPETPSKDDNLDTPTATTTTTTTTI